MPVRAGTALFVELIRNASSIAHAGGLRFAIDTNVNWAAEMSTAGPPRPFLEQVMAIVDEVTLMDYENECGSEGRAAGRVPQEAGRPCDMEKVL